MVLPCHLLVAMRTCINSIGSCVKLERTHVASSDRLRALSHLHFITSTVVPSAQIVDRPTQGHKFLSRSYVQPQWVIDSANFRVLMPVSLYAPGLVPPPHLSPFVDNEDEGYTPEFANTVKKLQVGVGGSQGSQRRVG